MIKIPQKSLYLLAAVAALFYTNAEAKERLTCPSLEKAAEHSKTATRQFAKRQMTWFKNQIITDKTLYAQYMKSFSEEIFLFIRNNVLTDSD